VLPNESVAVQVTVVVPTAKDDPDAGEQTTVGVPPSPLVAVGASKVTGVEHCPSDAVAETAAGHVIVGGGLSVRTVTTNVHTCVV
jgi:hypothetical protein